MGGRGFEQITGRELTGCPLCKAIATRTSTAWANPQAGKPSAIARVCG
jgi:hypothetical protein